MQVRDLEQALKLQEEFAAKLLDRVEALRKGSPPSPERIARDRETLLARMEARLDAAVKERETTVRLLDERIARLKADIENFDGEVPDMDERALPEEDAVESKPKAVARKKKTK